MIRYDQISQPLGGNKYRKGGLMASSKIVDDRPFGLLSFGYTMAIKIRLVALLFLSAEFAVGFANSIDANLEENKVETYATGTDINWIIDISLPSIREYFSENGFEPMHLDDMEEQVNNGVVKLTRGFLNGLTSIKRTADCSLIANNGVYNVDVTLGFDELAADYDYYFKYWLISRTGELDASMQSIEINIIADVDMENRKITLRSFKIVKLDKLTIKLKGHKLDPILNGVIKAIAPRFRNKMISAVEGKVKAVIQQYLNNADILPFQFEDRSAQKDDISESIITTFDILLS